VQFKEFSLPQSVTLTCFFVHYPAPFDTYGTVYYIICKLQAENYRTEKSCIFAAGMV
jgi:hypothetical protein